MSQVRKDVLNGWKEIAAYLGRDPRTVERWEKQRQLPVRRLPGGGRASVYALVPELDAWLARPPAEIPTGNPVPESSAAGSLMNTMSPVSSAIASPEPELEESDTAVEAGMGPTPLPLPVQEPEPGQPDPQPLVSQKGIPSWAGWGAVVACAAVALSVASWTYVRHRKAAPAHAAAKANPTAPIRALLPTSKVAGVEDLYLEGCYEAELRTPDTLQHAEASFTKAISKDPNYAPAYSGLASTFLLLREYSLLSDREAYDRAVHAVDQALRLDPELPQAHAVKGFVDFFWAWDPRKAAREFEAAEQLEPTLPLAHHWYGSMLTHEGRFSEALRELQLAQRLEPSSPAILTTRAYALGLSGRRAEGEAMLREAILTERPGQFRWPATMHQVLGVLSLLPPRDIPRFLSETMIAADLRHDGHTVRQLRAGTEAFRSKGEAAMWHALLLGEQRAHRDHPATYLAARYEAALGESDNALRDLEDLYGHHDPALIGIAIDPLFSTLRQQSRFGTLRKQLGIPETP